MEIGNNGFTPIYANQGALDRFDEPSDYRNFSIHTGRIVARRTAVLVCAPHGLPDALRVV
jgi:hypothetical protein